MRSCLDRLVTEKSLSLVNSFVSQEIPEQVLEQVGSKNVCAKVTPELSDEIDKVCDFLGISKRRFLEAAFMDAVETAHEIIRREGVYDAFRSSNEPAEETEK